MIRGLGRVALFWGLFAAAGWVYLLLGASFEALLFVCFVLALLTMWVEARRGRS